VLPTNRVQERLRRRWTVAECDEAKAVRLARELSLHPLAARVLVSRGTADLAAAGRFLDPMDSELPGSSPFTMRGTHPSYRYSWDILPVHLGHSYAQ
jgi:hypothetical protein